MPIATVTGQLGFIALLLFMLFNGGAYLLGKTLPNAELAFISRVEYQTDISLYDADKGMTWNLTRDGYSKYSFAWSSDGTQIAFASNRDHYPQPDLYTMDADGDHIHNLTQGAALYHSAASSLNWSPDSRHIAFVSNYYDDYLDIFKDRLHIIRLDGSHILDISPELSSGIFSLPSWSPDGQQFVFDPLYSYQTSEIFFVDMNDGMVNKRDVGVPFINTPTWSADGRYIAFGASFDGRSSNFVYEVNSHTLRPIPRGAKSDNDLVWSPDSRQLAFARDNSEANTFIMMSDIYVMDVDCADFADECHPTQHNLTDSADRDDRFPIWSPNGRQIAFISWDSGSHGAYASVVDADGRNIRRLFSPMRMGQAAESVRLTWSTDSRYLAVIARWGTEQALYTLHVATGAARLVPNQDYSNPTFAWRP